MPEIELKENCRPPRPKKLSRIPVRTRPCIRSPLAVVQPKAQSALSKSTSLQSLTLKPTRVKKVPNFSTIHKKWEKHLHKQKEENRVSTQIQEFALTPAGKFSAKKPPQLESNSSPTLVCTPVTTVSAKNSTELSETPVNGKQVIPEADGTIKKPSEGGSEDGSPFEVNPMSLVAILDEDSARTQVQFDHRVTIAGSTTTKPSLRMPTQEYFANHFRHSVYSKRRAARAGTSDNHREDSNPPASQIDKLCNELVQLSLARFRAISHDNTTGNTFNDIKMNLGPQFSQVAEAKTEPPTSLLTPSLSTLSTYPRTVTQNCGRTTLPPTTATVKPSPIPVTPGKGDDHVTIPVTPFTHNGHVTVPVAPGKHDGHTTVPVTPAKRDGHVTVPVTPGKHVTVPVTLGKHGDLTVPVTPGKRDGYVTVPVTPARHGGRVTIPITPGTQRVGLAVTPSLKPVQVVTPFKSATLAVPSLTVPFTVGAKIFLRDRWNDFVHDYHQFYTVDPEVCAILGNRKDVQTKWRDCRNPVAAVLERREANYTFVPIPWPT